MKDIDRQVAEKVMGYEYRPTKFSESPSYRFYMDGLRCTRFDWSPSTNIAHAWEVVEKMEERLGHSEIGKFGGEWYASFGWNGRTCLPLVYEEAETAPLAICKAALATVNNLDIGETNHERRKTPA